MILPLTSDEDPNPHVTIFLQTDLTNMLTYSILPTMNSYTCLGIQLNIDAPLTIINYYHHVVDKRPHLQHLLTLPLPDRPLLLCGDFNTHSPCWSPPELPTSPWAHTLEDWLDTGNLISLIPKGSVT